MKNILKNIMKSFFIVFFLFLGSGIFWAQDNRIAGIPPDSFVQSYLSETNEYAALYNGKVSIPYDWAFVNHPYFETAIYKQGTLCYDQVVYPDVYMRLDLYRDELSVVFAGRISQIVLEKERFNYAVLNGSTIVLSAIENDSKQKFVVLLYNGMYPVVRKHNLSIFEEISSRSFTRTFRTKTQYAVYKEGIPYTVKNKNSILKLFPDRKKELNAYAKQHKLSFNKDQIEPSVIALVSYYENMSNAYVTK